MTKKPTARKGKRDKKRTDKERLDFLSSNYANLGIYWDKWGPMGWSFKRDTKTKKAKRFKTLREAIDAALRSAEKRGAK